VIFGVNHQCMKFDDHFGSNYAGLNVLLNGHELGFSWSCMIQVSFKIKYVHLDQIWWIMVLDVLLD